MSDYIALIVARDTRFRVAIFAVASSGVPIASPQWAEQDGRPFEAETYHGAVDYIGQLPPRFWMVAQPELVEAVLDSLPPGHIEPLTPPTIKARPLPAPARVTAKRTRKGNARAK